MPTLEEPLQLGALLLPNRVIMAPLTRARAEVSRSPSALIARHYQQRASAGLIVSEATVVAPDGIGHHGTPGIWSPEQVEGWKNVTRAVHRAGGRIVCQLWHVGRVSHPIFLNGALPLAPSAIAPGGYLKLLRPQTSYVVPRAVARTEMPDIVNAFVRGAQNALEAGFDGVELHAANGYLLDQFLQDSTNRRTDDYGGCVENRARLLLEIVDRVVPLWGAGRVGVHLAPRGDAQDMGDSDPLAIFGHVASELGRRRLAFIFVRERMGADRMGPELKKRFGGALIANEGFTRESAEQALAANEADAVAFGKLFIANPDLPHRFATRAPLNDWQAETFYEGGPRGYVDYPCLAEEAAFA